MRNVRRFLEDRFHAVATPGLTTRRSGASLLNRDRRSIELGEREAFEKLVVAALLVAHNADGDGLAQWKRIRIIGAPMHGGVIASDTDVGRHLVHFASHRDLVHVPAGVRNQRQPVFFGLHDVGDPGEHKRVVKERLYDRGTGARYSGMTLAVGRVLRTAFWESVGQEIGAASQEGSCDGLRMQHVGMERIARLAGLGEVDQAPKRLGPKGAMHEPFLEPDRLERSSGHLGQ